jgi:ribosomal protein L37AE/L43A
MESWMRQEAPEHPFLIEIDGARYLRQGIEVHHVNEIKNDNRRDNLIACTSPGHKDLHNGNAVMRGETWPEPVHAIEAEPRHVERICKSCGKSFRVKRSTAKRGQGVFCSRKCMYGADISFSERGASEIRLCAGCGKEFKVQAYRVLKGEGKFCSAECYHETKEGLPPSHVFTIKEGQL